MNKRDIRMAARALNVPLCVVRPTRVDIENVSKAIHAQAPKGAVWYCARNDSYFKRVDGVMYKFSRAKDQQWVAVDWAADSQWFKLTQGGYRHAG